MPHVTFIDPRGQRTTVEIPPGVSVMEAAVKNGVNGIEAQCGGNCACATCHVYVDEAWLDRTGPPLAGESEMLEFTFDPRPNSRLSCQIRVTEALDGLVVTIAARQS